MGTAAVVAFWGRRNKGKELQPQDLPQVLLCQQHRATASKARVGSESGPGSPKWCSPMFFSSWLSSTASSLLLIAVYPGYCCLKPSASILFLYNKVKAYWPLGYCGFTSQLKAPFPRLSAKKCPTCTVSHRGQHLWGSQKLGEKNINAQRGACDGAGHGRAQGCSGAASWGGSARSLGDHLGTTTSLRSVDSQKTKNKVALVLMYYCVSCNWEFLLQKEAWQYVTWAVHISTRFIFYKSLFYTAQKLTTDSWSLEGRAAIVVNPACLGPAVTTAGVGEKRCLPPPLPPRSGVKCWPPKIFTKYTTTQFSFPAAA